MALLKPYVLARSAVGIWNTPKNATIITSGFCTSNSSHGDIKSYKVVILGGGTGGSAMANRCSRTYGKENVLVIEPKDVHYYQPMWTLVGGGIKPFELTSRPMRSLIPCDWIQDHVDQIDPDASEVRTRKGEKLKYDFLLVSMGLQLNYHMIKGAEEALKSDARVCSNYHPEYVHKTFPATEAFKEGNAVFTFPNAPIKCAGAPQKICYITENNFRQMGKREGAELIYNTSLPRVFGIPKYADALDKVVEERGIKLNTRTNLIEVDSDNGEAVFELLDEPGKTVKYDYNMLHISPPCSTPDVLRKCTQLVDASGFVDVDPKNLVHKKYDNVLAIGDCTNAPTAKTAAAAAAQSSVVAKSLKELMSGQKVTSEYNGYTSCPLVLSKGECILAEFGYDGKILETFPFDQTLERYRYINYHLKASFMPHLYWNGLVKGRWGGPGPVRKALHLGFQK